MSNVQFRLGLRPRTWGNSQCFPRPQSGFGEKGRERRKGGRREGDMVGGMGRWRIGRETEREGGNWLEER